MIKRMVLMLIAVALILGGVFGFKIFQGMMMKKFMSSMGAPIQTVSTITAGTQSWQPQIDAVGSLRAAQGVDVSSEVAGIVEQVNFKSGDDVKAGTLLVQLRAEDDIAKLNALKATANLAELTYNRDKKQVKVHAISEETLDQAAANFKSAQAQVLEQQAVVDKKSIRAPFDGHLGIRAVDLGQYISPATPIVTLQSLDSVFLDFFLPQQVVSQIKVGQKVTVTTDAWTGKTFTGTIFAINPKVDVSTRNVQVRAVIANVNHMLLPGMYAKVDIKAGVAQSHITLPQTAVTYNPYGDTVYLVAKQGTDKDGKPQLVAKQTFITVGETRGDQVAILSGVKNGDVVVTSGQIKLRNGAGIAINNTVKPSDDPHPSPSEE